MSGSQNPDIMTSVDYKNIMVLIDLCTQRGAFRAAELASVATVYEKLNRIVTAAEGTSAGTQQ